MVGMSQAEAETETVYVAISYRNQSNVYHTDPDCYRLSRSRGVREKDRSVLFHDAQLCPTCAGESWNGDTRQKMEDYCPSCQHAKPADGPCEWCERYEEVMGPYA